jgi:signal transduction histidine kinase
VPRLGSGYLVLALTLFAALAVGATGGLLLTHERNGSLAAVADRQTLLVSLQAHLIEGEVTRLLAEMQRLSQLAEVDLADNNLEPEKRVLRIARRDTGLFSADIAILDERGHVLWSEPQGTTLGPSGADLVAEARSRGRAVLTLSAGEIDAAAPIAGRGAIVGRVLSTRRNLFGVGLQGALADGGGVALLESPPGSAAPPLAVARLGAAAPPELPVTEGQRWMEDGQGRRWLVTAARVGDGPLVVRLVQPARAIEGDVARSLRSLVVTLAVALLLAVVGGALLALVIGRLERAQIELGKARDLAAMGKTAAAIAHEVKNSINGLSIALDLLASGRAAPAAAEEVHVQARSEIARLRDVADDLTLFAAPPRLELADVDLLELCRRASSACSDLAGDCEVELVLEALEAAPRSFRVRADEQKLLSALQNVVRNGVEAMGPGAFGEKLGVAAPDRERRLVLSLRRRKQRVVVEVADRGPGIAPEVRERLFEPFVTTKRTGTGLGLAIARRVVEAHGGELRALDREGGGTVFRMSFPVDGVGRGTASAARAVAEHE